MTEFAYNYAKNVNTGYILFKFNYVYYPHISFKNKTNAYLKCYSANKLTKNLKNLMSIC